MQHFLYLRLSKPKYKINNRFLRLNCKKRLLNKIYLKNLQSYERFTYYNYKRFTDGMQVSLIINFTSRLPCIYNAKVPFCKGVSVFENMRRRALIWAYVMIFTSSKLALLMEVIFYTSPRITGGIWDSVCFRHVEFKISVALVFWRLFILQEWEEKDWIEKYTKEKKTEKEKGKDEKNVNERSAKGKRRKMWWRKENAQRHRNLETISEERLNSSQPYTSLLHGFKD